MRYSRFQRLRSWFERKTPPITRRTVRLELEILDQRIVPAAPSSFESASGIAAKFGVYEAVLTGNGTVANPFNTKATVTFTSPSNQTFTVNDFYDGGNTDRKSVV